MRLGILVTPGYGHINPLRALADALLDYGHEVVFFTVADGIDRLGELPCGITVEAIGSNYPTGAMTEIEKWLSFESGLKALRQTSISLANLCRAFIQDAPDRIRAREIDALVIDQILFVGDTIAKITDLPFVTVAATVTLNPHPDIPPSFTTWKFHLSSLARLRNLAMYLYSIVWLSGPLTKVYINYRRSVEPEYGLLKIRPSDDVNSKIAVILNYPPSLEFYPHPVIKNHYFFSGHLSPRKSMFAQQAVPSFPDKYSDRPLVYASFGTVRNGSLELYKKVIAACETLRVRLLLSIGRNLNPEVLLPLPDNVMAVRSTPQKKVLDEATAFITHGGMNSLLESVSAGTPLVFLPQADDQGGVSVRGEAAGIGLIARENSSTIRHALTRVMKDPTFAANARKMAHDISECGGARAAAQFITSRLMAVSINQD